MSESSNRLIFFGTADFSVPSLQALIDGEFNVVAVVTKPDARIGRSKDLQPPAVKVLAAAHHIPVLQPDKLDSAAHKIKALKPTAGVVVSYGKIIPSSVMKLFLGGLINVHASLLPKYRGSSCIEQAILNGDDMTGVTLMQIDSGVDTGPIYATSNLPLLGTETKPQLHNTLSHLGADLLAAKLPGILAGTLQPIPQDDTQATKAPIIKKSDGIIHWKDSAIEIERQIRAYLGWPGSKTTIKRKEVTLTQAHAVPVNTPRAKPGDLDIVPEAGILMIETGNGKLCIDRLIPAGKKEMAIADFLRGLH